MNIAVIDKLIEEKPFDYNLDQYFYDTILFFDSIKTAFLNQYYNSEFYRNLVNIKYRKIFNKEFDVDNFINNVKKLDDFFKWYLFLSVWGLKEYGETDYFILNKNYEIELYSSGTKGKKSRIVLDNITLNRIKKIVFNIYNDYNLVDLENEINYLFFTYEIDFASNVGTAFSDMLLTSLAPKVKNKFFALKYDDDKKTFYFDIEGVINTLIKYSKEDLPIRILGFPAYIYFTIQEIIKRNLKFNFNGVLLPGGGWKTLSDQEIPKPTFRKLIKEYLGINEENVRDLYGLVEHGIPYVECEYFNMHIPNYSRIIVFNPFTNKFYSNTQEINNIGLISFITPYCNSYSISFVISSDVGYISKDCKCSRKGFYINLLGRAGKTKLRGCAINALQYLKNY